MPQTERSMIHISSLGLRISQVLRKGSCLLGVIPPPACLLGVIPSLEYVSQLQTNPIRRTHLQGTSSELERRGGRQPRVVGQVLGGG